MNQMLPTLSKIKSFLISFYVIGVVGFMIPISRPIFLELIPWALLLNVVLLLYFHKPARSQNYMLMLIVALLGFFVEVIGVDTGLLFGSYFYGDALGYKLLGVPLMIGINWFFLTYSVAVVLTPVFKSLWIKILLGATMITFYDFVMEPVAVFTGMWNWENRIIPVQNYIMWFILALFFVFLFTRFGRHNRNPLAGLVLLLQFMFFVVLHLFVKYL